MPSVFPLLAVAAQLLATQPPADSRTTGWSSDIDHLVAEARRQHAGPTRPAHAPAFARAADSLKKRIPSLPDRRVVVEIQRLMAMLHDGHSLVYPAPTARAPFAMLPIDVYLFRDGAYITDALPPWHGLIGMRITHIGPKRVDDVVAGLAPLVSRDNPMGIRAFASMYLISPAFLEALGATSDSNSVTFTLVDTSGRRRVERLPTGSTRRMHRTIVPPAGVGAIPNYLRDLDRAMSIRSLPGERTVFLQFNQVADQPGASIAEMSQRLADTVAANRATRLVVDVRHNVGGNNQLLAPLLDVVTRFAADTAARLCVITSRSTFSAAQNFITRLEQRAPRAVFAGEPSMSSPNFTGEDNPVTLPWSGVTVSISNRYWHDAPANDRREWIAPHILVAPAGRDWLANRDVVLDSVLRSPKCRTSR